MKNSKQDKSVFIPLNVMDRLGFIQDGVNAGRLLALGRNKFSDVLDDYDYENAVEWVFERLNDQIRELNTSLKDSIKPSESEV